MLRAKCMKARSIRAGSNPAGSRGAKQNLHCFLGLVYAYNGSHGNALKILTYPSVFHCVRT